MDWPQHADPSWDRRTSSSAPEVKAGQELADTAVFAQFELPSITPTTR